MRTTINVKDDLMKALMKRAMVSSKTKAIEMAIKEYLERQDIEDLISLSGRIQIDLDWEKEEQVKIKNPIEVTTDPHFKKIPGLKIHQPQASG